MSIANLCSTASDYNIKKELKIFPPLDTSFFCQISIQVTYCEILVATIESFVHPLDERGDKGNEYLTLLVSK